MLAGEQATARYRSFVTGRYIRSPTLHRRQFKKTRFAKGVMPVTPNVIHSVSGSREPTKERLTDKNGRPAKPALSKK
jgi:hypothetical protein